MSLFIISKQEQAKKRVKHISSIYCLLSNPITNVPQVVFWENIVSSYRLGVKTVNRSICLNLFVYWLPCQNILCLLFANDS